jgi:hypothetical protein
MDAARSMLDVLSLISRKTTRMWSQGWHGGVQGGKERDRSGQLTSLMRSMVADFLEIRGELKQRWSGMKFQV